MRHIAASIMAVLLLSLTSPAWAEETAHTRTPSPAPSSSAPPSPAPSDPARPSDPLEALVRWLLATLDAVEAVRLPSTVPAAPAALECDLRPSTGSGRDHWAGLASGGESPRDALRVALRDGWSVPQRGYRVMDRDDGAVLYGFHAGGEVKVAVRVVARIDGSWVPERLATCRLAEFGPGAKMGPGVWLWANRRGRTIAQRRLPVDCGWPSAQVMVWRSPLDPEQPRFTRWYVRDPEGLFRDQWQARYLRQASLPADARDTGYRRGRERIWMAADGRSVYVGRRGDTERWPRIEGVGCG